MPARSVRRGRLGSWEGRVYLAVGRALYLGPAGDTTPHRHHALQVSVGLDAPVRIRRGDGRWREYEAALVPPDVSHQVDGGWSPVLLLYLEPESADGRRWLAEPRSDIRALDRATVSAVLGAVRALARSPSSGHVFRRAFGLAPSQVAGRLTLMEAPGRLHRGVSGR